jgi:hypothetical protein
MTLAVGKNAIIQQLTAGFEKQFGSPMPKLELVAEYYFGMSPETAMTEYNKGRLPINIHRLGGRKSPAVVSTLELAQHAYERIKAS